MKIYIQDDNSNTVRIYHTSDKVQEAVETLLRQDPDLFYSETHKGYLIQILPKDQDWIMLEDALPEVQKAVLVTVVEPDGYQVCKDVLKFDSKVGKYYFEDSDITFVTAWMPLPDPFVYEDEDDEE